MKVKDMLRILKDSLPDAEILIAMPKAEYAFKIKDIKIHTTVYASSNIIEMYTPNMQDEQRILFVCGLKDKLVRLKW